MSESSGDDAGDATADLARVVRSLRADDEAAVARAAVDGVVDLVPADAAALFAAEEPAAGDDGEPVIRPLAAHTTELHAGPFRSLDEGVVGRAHRTGETQHVDDLGADPDAAPTVDAESALAVPTEAGVLVALAERRGAFDADDRAAVETLAAATRAELDRLRARTALDEQQDRFAALFENVPDPAVGYVLDDGEPVVDSVNAAFVRVFDVDAEAAIGEPLVDLVVPDDADGPVPEREGATDELEVERAAGDGRRSFLVHRVPVGGDPERGFCIYTDVSELKRRERELRAQNRRLETFASVVSHDLRNPLSIARGYAEMLDESDERDRVVDALRRMDRIVDDVLALARDHDDLDRRTVDVGDVARRAWASVATDGATLSCDGAPTLSADPDRLARLFENLFRNAVEHGSTSDRTSSDDAVEHGDGPAVTVGAVDGGFYVADDGPGIPAEERSEVFEEGYSSGNTTGLGLAIVAEIAAAHGWAVRATESEAGGARFEFRPEDGG